MEALAKKLQSTPIIARVVPFVIFLVLTTCQGQFGESSRYWFYLYKTLAGVWMVWAVWPVVTEARWAFSWEAVATGIGVCVIWVGLDSFYSKVGTADTPWNPHTQFGQGSAQAWFFIVVRLVGSTLVVPPLEEVFYRSFLYRYLIRLDFESIPLGTFHAVSFVMTSAVFGLVHPQQWLAGILCGFAYLGLVIRKNRLGDAMTAHAITNFLLGLWVICKGDWHFW